MRRYFLFLLILFPILSGITAAQNRPYGWTAWLHYGRHMTLVNAAGESLREVELPLPEGYSSALGAAISHNGDLIAYQVDIPGTLNTHIEVYDSVSQELELDYAVPAFSIVAPLMIGDYNFNEDDTALAIAYNFLRPSDGTFDWVIQVIDISTGHIIHQLTRDEFTSRNTDYAADRIYGVRVQRYDHSKISFKLQRNDTTSEMSDFVWNYVWNTDTADIELDIAYSGGRVEVFEPTGEIISYVAKLDYSNYTVGVYDPFLRARFPFFVSDFAPEPHFIQNAERIIMRNRFTDSTLVLVERNGEVIDQWSAPGNVILRSLRGTPDGFLYTVALRTRAMIESPFELEYPIEVPSLFAVDTRDGKLGTGHPIWWLSFKEFHERAKVEHPALEIVWVHSDMPASAYIPWAQLAPPVYEPTPVPPEDLPPPTMIPTPEPLFQVGMTVTVQTTGGEILNLRVDHTRKAEVIMYLEDDMKLTLLEGPVEAEGYTWWRVRTEDGIEGWTVENNGELQTLVPG